MPFVPHAPYVPVIDDDDGREPSKRRKWVFIILSVLGFMILLIYVMMKIGR